MDKKAWCTCKVDYCYLNLLLFCRSFCHRRRHCLSSHCCDPKFCYRGNVMSHFSSLLPNQSVVVENLCDYVCRVHPRRRVPQGDTRWDDKKKRVITIMAKKNPKHAGLNFTNYLPRFLSIFRQKPLLCTFYFYCK